MYSASFGSRNKEILTGGIELITSGKSCSVKMYYEKLLYFIKYKKV